MLQEGRAKNETNKLFYNPHTSDIRSFGREEGSTKDERISGV
jgi:hypothetical protein